MFRTAYVWAGETGQSYGVVSDSTTHSEVTASIRLEMVSKETLIKCPTDGAASQFKNKYIMNFASKLAERKAITLEWNIFATSHEKGVVDGIGAILKKMADTLSLRQKAVPTGINITDANSFIRACQGSTFIKLLEYGTTEMDTMELVYSKVDEDAVPISAIQKRHQFRFIGGGLLCANTSKSPLDTLVETDVSLDHGVETGHWQP